MISSADNNTFYWKAGFLNSIMYVNNSNNLNKNNNINNNKNNNKTVFDMR